MRVEPEKRWFGVRVGVGGRGIYIYISCNILRLKSCSMSDHILNALPTVSGMIAF